MVVVIVALKNVGEEEQFHYGKHNEKLNKYNHPQFPSYGHGSETVKVKPENFTGK